MTNSWNERDSVLNKSSTKLGGRQVSLRAKWSGRESLKYKQLLIQHQCDHYIGKKWLNRPLIASNEQTNSSTNLDDPAGNEL